MQLPLAALSANPMYVYGRGLFYVIGATALVIAYWKKRRRK